MIEKESFQTENIIMNRLVHDDRFFSKVIPFIKKEYFESNEEKILFEIIDIYFKKYNARIQDTTILKVLLNELSIDEGTLNKGLSYIATFIEKRINITVNDEKWLDDITEKFCLDRAVYLAIFKSIEILEGNDKTTTKDALPGLLQDALSVSFNQNIGLNYFKDANERWGRFSDSQAKYPCSLESVNRITNKGFEKQTLNVFSGSKGAGKSILLCQLAKDYIDSGHNVLFITLEMSEDKMAIRIDANSMNINVNKIPYLSKSVFLNKIKEIQDKTKGTLIIKQYAGSTAHCGHFEALLKELQIKEKFLPDVIIVDYIGICLSKAVPISMGIHLQGKGVAEELRAMAIKHDAIVFSVMQFGKQGAFNSDAGHADLAGSSAIEDTVDFLAALIVTEELREKGRVILKQMKNRYADVNNYKKQMMKLDTNMMRYSDMDDFSVDDVKDAPSFTKIAKKVSKTIENNNFKGIIL